MALFRILGSPLHAPAVALQGRLHLCGHPMHHGLQLGTPPPPVSTTQAPSSGSLGPPPSHPAARPTTTIWILSAGPPSLWPGLGSPSVAAEQWPSGWMAGAPGLLLLLEKLALGSGAAWGIGRTVAGGAGAGVLGGAAAGAQAGGLDLWALGLMQVAPAPRRAAPGGRQEDLSISTMGRVMAGAGPGQAPGSPGVCGILGV